MKNSMVTSFSGGQLTLAVMLSIGLIILPDFVYAIPGNTPGGTTIASVLCKIVNWFRGPVGRGIATLAIIVIGIGALMGKVSWGMAIVVAIGVVIIFGAPTIVQELGNTSTQCPTTSTGLTGGGPFGR